MLFSVATGVGLQKKIKEKVSGFNGDIQITYYDSNNSKVTVSPISTEQPFYPDFKEVENVERLQVFATKAGIIRTPNEFEGIILKGVGKDFDWAFFEDYLVSGNLPSWGERAGDQVLLSEKTSNRLQLQPGDEFHMFFVKDDPNMAPNSRKFKVAGVYNSGFEEFDETFMIGDIRHIQRMNKWQENEVGGFEVFVKDFSSLQTTGNEVYNAIDPALNAFTVEEKYPSIFEWLSLFDTNIVVIIGIMVLIAGINMITALLVLILERTQMIGILKALGNSNWSIRKIFLYNASFLIGKGLLWGNLIGLGLLMIQRYFGVISLNPETYYVDEAPVYISVPAVLSINIGTLLLCLLMLLIPSLIVSKISPVKAIKFD